MMKYSNLLKKWTLARNQNGNYIDRIFLEDEKRVELLNNSSTKLVILNLAYFEELTSNPPQNDFRKLLARHFNVVEKILDIKKL